MQRGNALVDEWDFFVRCVLAQDSQRINPGLYGFGFCLIRRFGRFFLRWCFVYDFRFFRLFGVDIIRRAY